MISSNKRHKLSNIISTVNIPTDVLTNRDYSMLESIVIFLKDKCNFTYSHIADLLNRDDRTIWTTYQRAKKKEKNNALCSEKSKLIEKDGVNDDQ